MLAVGTLSLLVGCAEIVWHYVARADELERARSRHVVGQLLPALFAGVYPINNGTDSIERVFCIRHRWSSREATSGMSNERVVNRAFRTRWI